MKRISKEEMIVNIALQISERSTCSRLKVGSVITDESIERILSWGYNGNWKGGPNKCDSDTPGACGCVHSENNALIKCDYEKGRVMFITHQPCASCAKLIVNSGIKKIYYRNNYRLQEGLNILFDAGVEINKI